MPNVSSSLLTMLCQCTFDACCFATMFEWMFLDDPLIDLALVDLGACIIFDIVINIWVQKHELDV